ncbi:lipopolysaccharide biosynthesis protein [Polaribacter sp.]|uniref:lipopolysaccharide biosynthesis protein n=2 Tax=Polaribacter sp. TaxID=1920175 RepID=UPI004048E6B2
MSIYFGSQMISALLPIIIIPIISRTISVSDYGVYSLYKALFAFMIPLIGFSFSNAVIRKYYVIDKVYFKRYIVTLMFIITLGAILFFAVIIINKNYVKEILQIADSNIVFFSLYVVYFTCISMLFFSYYRVKNQTRNFLYGNIINVTLTILGIVFLKFQGILILNHILKVHLIAASFTAFFNMSTFFKTKLDFKLDFSHIKDTFLYCSPLIVYSIFAQIYVSSDRFIINSYLGKNNVALYSAGIQMAFVIPMIGQAIQLAWTPYVFERLTIDGFSSKLKKITFTLVGLLVIFSVIYTLIYPFIFKLFLPYNYYSVLKFYYLFITAGLFQSLYWLYNPFLLFFERNSFFIYITVVAAIVSLTLNFLFVNFGLIWVASIFAFSWLIQLVLLLISITYVKNSKKNQ